jgi:hypothetical protein
MPPFLFLLKTSGMKHAVIPDDAKRRSGISRLWREIPKMRNCASEVWSTPIPE